MNCNYTSNTTGSILEEHYVPLFRWTADSWFKFDQFILYNMELILISNSTFIETVGTSDLPPPLISSRLFPLASLMFWMLSCSRASRSFDTFPASIVLSCKWYTSLCISNSWLKWLDNHSSSPLLRFKICQKCTKQWLQHY